MRMKHLDRTWNFVKIRKTNISVRSNETFDIHGRKNDERTKSRRRSKKRRSKTAEISGNTRFQNGANSTLLKKVEELERGVHLIVNPLMAAIIERMPGGQKGISIDEFNELLDDQIKRFKRTSRLQFRFFPWSARFPDSSSELPFVFFDIFFFMIFWRVFARKEKLRLMSML